MIDLKSGAFSVLIKDIFDACEALKFYSKPEKTYGITELQLRAFFKKTFLQIEKYSDKLVIKLNFLEKSWKNKFTFPICSR